MGLAALNFPAVMDATELDSILRKGQDVDPERRTKLEVALGWIDKAIATLPAEADINKTWATTWGARAAILTQLGEFTEALLATDKAIEIAAPAEKPPLLAVRLTMLKGAEVEQGRLPWSKGPHADHEKATRMAEALANHEGVSEAAVYNAACALALASQDAKASPAERRRRADQAMAYLRQIAAKNYFQARATGFRAMMSPRDTLKELCDDADLKPLRDRPDFQALLKSVTK